MRGAFDTDNKKSPIHIVSAWASENEMVLVQVKTDEKRYYISSLKDSIEEFSTTVRKYWEIESTHWILDVVFKEDGRRVRKDYGPQNLALLKRLALNIIKKDTTEPKYSLKSKRFAASVDNNYLEQVLIKNFI
ncbi:ISAs1 family transposase [Clostridium kluyveri]|uniref:Transposase IS4-like domain-containing protein n=1 Tax=Clostridium kluyveri TaxID=1534 RepID=A0A1L5F9H4_CLOKL|nr:ISAs1 family transposase [Clostridium kluyveri]APM39668.1 hypothetical protein BS101_13430 [Clostridium kluyveri]UZQ50176.1 ISAs1 family transposase [Clostridium kluyveri]